MIKNCQYELCEHKADYVRIEISYSWNVLYDRFFCSRHIDPTYEELRYFKHFMVFPFTFDKQELEYGKALIILKRHAKKKRHAMEVEREIDRTRMIKEKMAGTLDEIVGNLVIGK